jgi:hypothetical protein
MRFNYQTSLISTARHRLQLHLAILRTTCTHGKRALLLGLSVISLTSYVNVWESSLLVALLEILDCVLSLGHRLDAESLGLLFCSVVLCVVKADKAYEVELGVREVEIVMH